MKRTVRLHHLTKLPILKDTPLCVTWDRKARPQVRRPQRCDVANALASEDITGLNVEVEHVGANSNPYMVRNFA